MNSHFSASIQSRPSTAISTKTKSSSLDGKRSRARESVFVLKHGQKHHSYDNEKAPYSLCYDRRVLELESLDNRLIKHLRSGSVSFIKFDPDDLPERCLDLGCGTGTWIIDAASEWPHCEFVGFDLVNIQVPSFLLDKSIADRISWVHGNFVTTKLPFEDGEFDHVHIQNISAGVPENKWDVLFQEVSRVLRPGGSVEIIENDAIFPTLPRWFTSPLRARPRRAQSVHLPSGSVRSRDHISSQGSQSPTFEETPHDHALLESLYKSVFEHRFVNMKPTAILPGYFGTYFRQCKFSSVLSFPFPPLPPPQPAPPPLLTQGSDAGLSEALDPRPQTMLFASFEAPKPRPVSLSFSSTLSGTSGGTSRSNGEPMPPTGSPATNGSTGEDPPKTAATVDSPMNGYAVQGEDDYATEYYPHEPGKLFITDCVKNDDNPLLDTKQLYTLSERSLAMHLYRSYVTVLACEEAMWEEMSDRLRNRREELRPFGWDDDDELEELHSRKRFERLIERYRSDMIRRISMWCSLQDVGWPFPPRDPLSKAELIEEERIREAMLEARRIPHDDSEPQLLSRSLRVIVGYNPLTMH